MEKALTHLTIKDLLPHRSRMLLIDDILEVSEEEAVSCSRVSDRWPLFNGEAVNPLMIIELVAQTSGLSNGLDRIQKEGKDVDRKGWLVGIRKARFFTYALPLGARIITKAKNQFKFEGFREISGKSMIGPETIGEVTLQVVRADTDENPDSKTRNPVGQEHMP